MTVFKGNSCFMFVHKGPPYVRFVICPSLQSPHSALRRCPHRPKIWSLKVPENKWYSLQTVVWRRDCVRRLPVAHAFSNMSFCCNWSNYCWNVLICCYMPKHNGKFWIFQSSCAVSAMVGTAIIKLKRRYKTSAYLLYPVKNPKSDHLQQVYLLYESNLIHCPFRKYTLITTWACRKTRNWPLAAWRTNHCSISLGIVSWVCWSGNFLKSSKERDKIDKIVLFWTLISFKSKGWRHW